MAGSLQPAVVGGEEANLSLTTELWNGINRHTIRDDPGSGWFVEKRFNLPSVYATTVAQDGIYPFLDTSDTVRGGTTIAGGALTLATAATDNNSPTIQWGGTTGGVFQVSKTSPRNWAFEVFFQVGTIVETGILLGLGEPGMAADNGCLVDDTGAMADKSFVGFRGPMHASVLTTVCNYRKSSQTEVTALAAAHVPAVTTWYSYGMRQRYGSGRNYLEWWMNGSKVKELDLTNTTSVPTATFPFDVSLSPVFCVKAGAAAAKSLSLRSVHVFQRPYSLTSL